MHLGKGIFEGAMYITWKVCILSNKYPYRNTRKLTAHIPSNDKINSIGKRNSTHESKYFLFPFIYSSSH